MVSPWRSVQCGMNGSTGRPIGQYNNGEKACGHAFNADRLKNTYQESRLYVHSDPPKFEKLTFFFATPINLMRTEASSSSVCHPGIAQGSPNGAAKSRYTWNCWAFEPHAICPHWPRLPRRAESVEWMVSKQGEREKETHTGRRVTLARRRNG